MGSTQATPFRLTPQLAEEAAAWARLLAGAYEVPLDPTGRLALTDAVFASRLTMPVSAEFRLADWMLMRLAPEETLSPFQYGVLDTTEQILTAIVEESRLSAAIGDLICRQRTLFAAAATSPEGWVTNPHHPARELLANVFQAAIGWHPELGAGAGKTREQVEGWFAAIAGGTEGWAEVAARASGWVEEERRKIARLEQRCIDAETGILRERRSRQLAARTLNQSFAGRPVSREIAELLAADLLPAMQWVLLKQGEQSPVWQRLRRLCGTLRWTLSPETGDSWRNQLYKLIAQVTEELAAIGPQVFQDAQACDRFVAQVDREHLNLLANEPRDVVEFAARDSGDAVAGGDIEISADLLASVLALETGGWLLVTDGPVSRRVRVLLRQDETRQLVGVNALGMKAWSASYEAVALGLIDGAIEILPRALSIESAIAGVIESTRVRQQQAQQTRMERLRVMREKAAAEARERDIARQKALAEAQALEAARLEAKRKAEEALLEEQRRADEAHREAQRRAEESAREAARIEREQELARLMAEEQQRAAAQQRQQRARLQVSSLTIGAWLVFRDEPGKEERRRLTVVLPSSGKHIFVDGNGVGKREVGRDELIRGFAEGRVALLTADRRLDDTLTRVVDNLRGDTRMTGGT